MIDGRLVVGLVGYGYWGPNLLRNYVDSHDATVKWVCDMDPIKLAMAKIRYPAVTITEDFHDVLRDHEVEAVLVATPISTHFDLTMAALEAGKHVFVEKPLAASVVEAEGMIALAERKSLTLMVGHTFEFSPPVVKVKELIEAGELGDIYYVASSRVNLGLHQRDVSVIWDLAPHDFSILFYWMGEEPVHVSAFGRSCVTAYNNLDVAFINVGFASGTVAELELSWLSPVKLRRTVIVGSRKMLLYDDTESVEKVKLYDHGVKVVEPGSFGEYQLSYRTGDIVSPHLEAYEPLAMEAQHFLDCVLTGKRPRTDGNSGLQVVRALERAEASLVQGGSMLDWSGQASAVPGRKASGGLELIRSGTVDGEVRRRSTPAGPPAEPISGTPR